jgi:hypothetical protein
VVPRLLHGQTKGDGLPGALLADDLQRADGRFVSVQPSHLQT